MILCDCHCDTLYNLATRPDAPTDVTLERLKEGGVSLQTLAMYVGPKGRKGDVEALFDAMLKQFHRLLRQGWVQADDPNEAEEGKVKVMLSIEGCEPFDRGLHTIRFYREQGVRMAAITWNHENALGYPAMGGSDRGLKPYGVEAIREMQRLGIAADVSHLNERGFYDIFLKTDKPPMASHSNCRALVDHPRNLSDDQLKTLFENGGFVGVNFWPTIIGEPATPARLAEHIDHMYQLGGQGKVGLGSDFDGIERKPEGIRDPRDFGVLLSALRNRGFAEADVADVAGRALQAYFRRIAV